MSENLTAEDQKIIDNIIAFYPHIGKLEGTWRVSKAQNMIFTESLSNTSYPFVKKNGYTLANQTKDEAVSMALLCYISENIVPFLPDALVPQSISRDHQNKKSVSLHMQIPDLFTCDFVLNHKNLKHITEVQDKAVVRYIAAIQSCTLINNSVWADSFQNVTGTVHEKCVKNVSALTKNLGVLYKQVMGCARPKLSNIQWKLSPKYDNNRWTVHGELLGFHYVFAKDGMVQDGMCIAADIFQNDDTIQRSHAALEALRKVIDSEKLSTDVRILNKDASCYTKHNLMKDKTMVFDFGDDYGHTFLISLDMSNMLNVKDPKGFGTRAGKRLFREARKQRDLLHQNEVSLTHQLADEYIYRDILQTVEANSGITISAVVSILRGTSVSAYYFYNNEVSIYNCLSAEQVKQYIDKMVKLGILRLAGRAGRYGHYEVLYVCEGNYCAKHLASTEPSLSNQHSASYMAHTFDSIITEPTTENAVYLSVLDFIQNPIFVARRGDEYVDFMRTAPDMVLQYIKVLAGECLSPAHKKIYSKILKRRK